MAIYFLNIKTFGRAGGSSAVSAAAYRAGERIHDERTGRTFDHSGRRDVMHKEILVPGDFVGSALDWMQDRAQLWNTAERAEVRKNARVAREYLVALPFELGADQRLKLARSFSRELANRYRFAVDLAVHAPRDFPGSDPRNYHAHLLATTREVTAQGLGAKTTLEFSEAKRRDVGLPPSVHEFLFARERWAALTNLFLAEAHLDVRVDHRTLAAQGIDREPYPHIPRASFEMERHGYRSFQAERIRSDYAARVLARCDRTAAASAEVAPAARRQLYEVAIPARAALPTQSAVLQQPAVGGPPDLSNNTSAPKRTGLVKPSAVPELKHFQQSQTLEEIRRQAREDWLRMRQEATQRPAESSAADHGHDYDDKLSR